MKKVIVASIVALVVLAVVAGAIGVKYIQGHVAPYGNVRRFREVGELQARLKDAAAKCDRLSVEALGGIHYGGFEAPLWRVTFTPDDQPDRKVFLSGGVHGNEPAGAEAAVRFVEALSESPGKYAGVAFDIFPLVNPWGWAHNRRRNQQGLDVNRDFASFNSQEGALIRDFVQDKRYDLAIDHHEHPGGHGFYLYQIASDEAPLSRRVIAHQRDRGHPIEQNVRMVIFKTRDGLMRIPGWSLPFAKIGRMLSMTNYLRMQGNPRVYLIETPTTADFEDRVSMHEGAREVLLQQE